MKQINSSISKNQRFSVRHFKKGFIQVIEKNTIFFFTFSYVRLNITCNLHRSQGQNTSTYLQLAMSC